jgi:hypothetical protein
MPLCADDQTGDEPVADGEPDAQVTTPPREVSFEVADGDLVKSSTR